MTYRAIMIVKTKEEITESELSDRIESPNFDPFIEVLDSRLEEVDENEERES